MAARGARVAADDSGDRISQRQPAREDAFSDLVLLLCGAFRGVVFAGAFLRFLRRR